MPLIFKHQQGTQRFRVWAAVGSAAVGVVGNYMVNKNGSKQQNGGAGTQTVDKAPWSEAQPWIKSNMARGQQLQQQLMDQPFSPQQQAAYNNSFAQGDYMRALVPSLLGQMQNQQVGFDPNNPNARPSAWNWDALAEGATKGPNMNQQSVLNAAPPPAPAAAPAARDPGTFRNFDAASNPLASYYGAWLSPESTRMLTDNGDYMRQQFQSALGDAGGAGFGDFKYGSAAPTAGTQAYRDMNEYFQYGGNDPFNIYGRAVPDKPFSFQNAGGA